MLTDFFDRYAADYRPYKKGSWCYEDGCLYRGLEMLHRRTGEDRWLDHIIRLVADQIEVGPGLKGYDPSEYNIDNVLSGRALLYLFSQTGDANYLDVADLLAGQLETHPRTRSGVYWHKLRYPWQIWLDGLYMGAPFQVGYGKARQRQDLVDDSLTQLAVALRETYVAKTRLYAHAVDEARRQAWADPATGQSRAHWARALGWLSMCLVDVAELVGPAAFAPLAQQTADLFARILELRTKDGLWLQVIDAPDLPGNYLETSASAMFVYALTKAQGLGLIGAITDDLFAPLADYSVDRAADGNVRMRGICEVAGLGGFQDQYRDGSPEYYLTEPVVNDDPKGVGPLMMCAALASKVRDESEAAVA